LLTDEVKPKLQKNVAFVNQWLSQNAAFKPDLAEYFEERFAHAGWTGDVEMLKDLDREDPVKIFNRGGNSILFNAFMKMHGDFATTVMAMFDMRTYFG
jgi:hypothetical protein